MGCVFPLILFFSDYKSLLCIDICTRNSMKTTAYDAMLSEEL